MAVVIRPRPPAPARAIELTALPGIAGVLRRPYVLNALRGLTVFLLASAIWFGLTDPTGSGAFTLALMWGIFWPFFTSLVTPTLGNAFCSVCPHGFMGKYLSRIGLKRHAPRWLIRANIGLVLVMVTYWAVSFAAPAAFARSADITAGFFLAYTLLAAASFLVWRDMAYCRHICPLGGVLTAYARAGSAWITTEAKNCATCRSFDCARACPHHLSPFRFEERNDMADCTLCMDCATACTSVKVELRRPGHQLARPVARDDGRTARILLWLTAVAAVGVQFQHGLNHTPLAAMMPWNLAGGLLADRIPMPAWFQWSGLVALLLAIGLTLGAARTGWGLVARLAGRNRAEVAAVLGHGLAPLACIAMLAHGIVFFLAVYAPKLWNSAIAAYGLPAAEIGPLVARGTPWLGIFDLLPWIAILWSLRVMHRRTALVLPAGTPRGRHLLATTTAAAPVLLYVLVLVIKLWAATQGMPAGHVH